MTTVVGAGAVFFLWIFSLLLTQDPVISISIECIPTSQCPTFTKLLKISRSSPETLHFLKTYQCGVDDNDEAKVWCTLFDSCSSPDSKKGICTPLSKCDSLQEYINSVNLNDPMVQKYLKYFQCPFRGGEPRVCCSDEEKNKDSMLSDHDVYNRHLRDDNFGHFPHYPKPSDEDFHFQHNPHNHRVPHFPSPDLHPDEDFGVFPKYPKYPKTPTSTPASPGSEGFQKNPSTPRPTFQGSGILPDVEKGECGQQNEENRIVGGTDTYLDEYPWMALMKYSTTRDTDDSRYACAAVLISKRHVLTAAHCVDPEIIKSKGLGKLSSVILGEYDTRNETDCIYQKYGTDCADKPQDISVESTRIHPDYNSTMMTNDLAIIGLANDVKFSDYVQPICLPKKSLQLQDNEEFIVSGWGRTENQKRSPVKQKAKIRLVRKEKCNRFRGRRNILSPMQICVGEGNGSDSCYGDSGGPLMLEQSSRFYTVGVVSYGSIACGTSPGVYTFIPQYLDWIQQNV